MTENDAKTNAQPRRVGLTRKELPDELIRPTYMKMYPRIHLFPTQEKVFLLRLRNGMFTEAARSLQALEKGCNCGDVAITNITPCDAQYIERRKHSAGALWSAYTQKMEIMHIQQWEVNACGRAKQYEVQYLRSEDSFNHKIVPSDWPTFFTLKQLQ
eukprot:CAMPEP_0177679560 /NCGR_PEP_ID=MMETSP0447-20121125/29671_1 /TAXON_ID=0 /ORGANISM="Stygamoeba regulata, Strain BSH-02190019" /LENGTH=156 /DNA_ID=CAMNT_0019188765 /DNA_START=58 /DNA_END=525 /DNA_ORIENTATION=+